MLCEKCVGHLKRSVDSKVITETQFQKLLAFLGMGEPPDTQAIPVSKETTKSFNAVMVVYYIGAVLILSAFGWFLGSQWDFLGP